MPPLLTHAEKIVSILIFGDNLKSDREAVAIVCERQPDKTLHRSLEMLNIWNILLETKNSRSAQKCFKRNDTYEVLFDDNFVKVVNTFKLAKLNATKPSPLFDPVKGTKQERRDKKRKLDVAALFRKRPRVTETDEKKNKICHNSMDLLKDDLTVVRKEEPISGSFHPQWHAVWENGRPMGVESTLETGDSSRKSVIVTDPRLPTGWVKHIVEKSDGNSTNKWDIIIVAPEGNQFRSRSEVKTYLELHPELEIDSNIFDFSISRKRKTNKSQQKQNLDNQSAEHLITPPLVEESDFKAGTIEEPPVSLKIIFENNTYKCPIEGCGKNFRRENLALMHVKHYHSEYTKYLDSTPNVADLAYARTVGENLDRSPGLSKCSTKSVVDKASGPTRTSKMTSTSQIEQKIEEYSVLEQKSKDTEIIKLLNKKPAESTTDIQPLPSGLPSSMYPDIKLKDLLGKTDELHMRDNINIKNLCTSRPSHGIKTLLPIRTNQLSSNGDNVEKPGLKHNTSSAGNELTQGEELLIPRSEDANGGENLQHSGPLSVSEHQQNHQLQQPPPQTQHLSHPPLEVSSQTNQQSQIESGAINASVPLAFDLTPFAGLDDGRASTTAQLDGVIIEGGKIIKLERMKQEEIINCTCGFIEEDGLMIQCELCLCWQHAYCNNIQKENEVPEKYICFICLHPIRERRSSKYLHDQEWLKQGTLPVAFHHDRSDDLAIQFQKLKKLNDLSGGTRELKEYLYTLAIQLKVAEAKNHPKLYLWSTPWEKLDLPQYLGSKNGESVVIKPKYHTGSPQYKEDVGTIKHETRNDSMLMMILKSDKEEIPMLNIQNTTAPVIPQPEAAIDSNDCRLNLLEHIAHAESLIEDRLNNFEKQLDVLEKGIHSEADQDNPMIKQTLQLLLRDLNTLEKFSELPLV